MSKIVIVKGTKEICTIFSNQSFDFVRANIKKVLLKIERTPFKSLVKSVCTDWNNKDLEKSFECCLISALILYPNHKANNNILTITQGDKSTTFDCNEYFDTTFTKELTNEFLKYSSIDHEICLLDIEYKNIHLNCISYPYSKDVKEKMYFNLKSTELACSLHSVDVIAKEELKHTGDNVLTNIIKRVQELGGNVDDLNINLRTIEKDEIIITPNIFVSNSNKYC